jgi:Ca2+-binding EF-hand superfamily protein
MDLDDPDDAAALAAQKEAAAAEAQQLFSKFDADGSGSLDKTEVRLLLEAQGVCVTPQYLAGLIEAFDTDGDGTFDRKEFSELAKVVISRSVEAQNDVESLWYWLGLKYRYRDQSTSAESAPMSLDVVQMRIARGQITDSTPFQCQNQTGGWEDWGPLSEWKEFYVEGFVPALAQAAKRTTRAEDAGDLFDQYDADSSGALDRGEVIALLGGLGLATDDGYIDGMLDAYDTDGSGDVDREEFQKLFEAILGRGAGEEGSPDGVAGAGVESALFWLGVQYRYMDETGAEAHGVESASLSFAEFTAKLAAGLDDETPLQVSEPGGGWLPYEPIREYKAKNLGFREALAGIAGLSEGLPPNTSSRGFRSRSPSPTLPSEDGDEQVRHQLHVRGIGVDGWDGTEDGVGAYESEEALQKIFSAFGRVLFSKIRHRVADGANTSWALITMGNAEAVDAALAAEEVLAGTQPLVVTRFDADQAAASKGGMVQVQEDSNREAKQFWHGLQYRFKVEWDDDVDENGDQTHVFGLIRQKVLHGEIDDATYVQICSEGEWGEWITLRECKDDYDGFAEAVGKAVASDTLAEYKKAFSLFDKDGSGEIDAGELGTVMKSLGVETTDEEVEEMLAVADADGSGEIDFNEFLALMTERMGSEGEERLRNAKTAFWALQSYKYLLRLTLVYQPKVLNRDWSPRFSTLRDKNGWIRAKTA